MAVQWKRDKGIVVFGLFDHEQTLSNAIAQLRAENFRPDDISALFPDKSTSRDLVAEINSKAPEGATTGGATGALLGGLGGWLLGIGALAIPGLGPFIAAGPIMAALGGAAIGGTVGGVAGALIGAGVPEVEAKQFEAKVREGGFFLSVHADDGEWADKAERVLKMTGAREITTTKESNVPGAPDRRHVKAS